MRFLIRNQHGFSLIQGMILASAVAMMAYVGTKLSNDQKMAIKGMEAKAKVDQLHDAIFSILQNKDHCTATFKINNLDSDLSTIPKSFSKIVTAPDLLVLFENSAGDINKVYMNQSVTIESMQLTYPDFTVPFNPTSTEPIRTASIKINYGKLQSGDETKRTHRGFGGSNITKTISVVIQKNPSNSTKFLSCYAVSKGENDTLSKDFCLNLLGMDSNGNRVGTPIFTWNDDLNSCVLKDLSCPSGLVFTGFSSLGTPICKSLQDAMNFSDLIDTTQSNCSSSTTSVQFKTTPDMKKIQIICQ